MNLPEEARQKLLTERKGYLNIMSESLSPADRAIFLLNKWGGGRGVLAAEFKELGMLKDEAERGAHLLRPWRRWKIMKRLHSLLQDIDRYKEVQNQDTVGGTSVHQIFHSLWYQLWFQAQG